MRIPHNFWGFKSLKLMKCGVKNLKKLVSVLVSVRVGGSLLEQRFGDQRDLRVDGPEPERLSVSQAWFLSKKLRLL